MISREHARQPHTLTSWY